MTNPIVSILPFYTNLRFGIIERNIILVILEIFAFALEGLVYTKWLKYKKINGYVLSLTLNVSSFVIGSIINSIIY